jgi:hypothetical protein
MSKATTPSVATTSAPSLTAAGLESNSLAGNPSPKKPLLVLRNHGLKSRMAQWGTKDTPCPLVPKADLYLDCRGLIDGHQVDLPSAQYRQLLEEACNTTYEAMVTTVVESLKNLAARRRFVADPTAEPYEILCLCAYGMHRSKASKHILAGRLKALGYDVTVA